MRFTSPLALALLAGTLSHALPAPQDTPTSTVVEQSSLPTSASSDPAIASEQLEELAQFAQQQVEAALAASSSKRGTCNKSTLAVRREWNALSKTERKAYTDAVLCLQAKKANTPASVMLGAKSRFDDFVGNHILKTLEIHYTGTFLAWHRYFTWQYEQALRNECGYKGYQPYWDWAKTAASGLDNSPMLDGSAYSMSGNGKFIPGQGQVVIAGRGEPYIYIPAGTGGGCVESGPFKDMKVNLGPVALSTTNGTEISNGNGLSYNPRCLTRDLTDYSNKKWANATAIADLIINKKDIWQFEMVMQGVPGTDSLGVHGGGHYSMGGDPGRDFFVSPGDPLFYLHHGMIDKTWWVWQQLDIKTRTSEKGGISGTGTFLNMPPSANTTFDTVIDLGYAASGSQRMEDLMSTTSGPFCYIYV